MRVVKKQSNHMDNYDFWKLHLETLGYNPGDRFKHWFFKFKPNPNLFSSVLLRDNRINWYDHES